jgi:NodT family efflux transporter outer membrane factor (OMF) lipoprotein
MMMVIGNHIYISMKRTTIILFIILTLAGCVSVGPDYRKPEIALPSQWNQTLVSSATASNLDIKILATWWSKLNDPALSSLIDRAILGNLDLREAKARVREARAQRGVSVADQFPSVDATASASRNRTSGGVQNLYSAGFDASWELDLFGGKRRSVEAAQGTLEASEEDLRDVLVTLVAEVALNYVDIRAYQTRLGIAEANRDAQQETYQITQWRLEGGLITALDVEQARYSLEQTRSQIPPLQTSLEKSKNRLALLLGKHPGSLEEELSERKFIPVAPVEIAVGIPADVLRNRPDVRRAERKLAAQTAKIGVAAAEIYPKLALNGSIGFEALSAGSLFTYGNRVYGFGPSITWNIFDAGRIRKNIAVQSALQEQALIQYEAAILSALEGVNNALVAYVQEQVHRQTLNEAKSAAQRAVELARSRYESGLVDFQVVLDAQRSLLTFQDSLAVSEAEVTADLIRLYKALGGGWTPMAPAAAASDQPQKS